MNCLAIDNEICCAELIQNLGDKPRLYDIPVQIGTEIAILRCGETWTSSEDGKTRRQYELYGVWEGYDDNSDLPNRSVEPLAMLAGREYRPVFPINMSENSRQVSYSSGLTRTVPRALRVSIVTVPAGTSSMRYELIDVFMREMDLDMIEIHWDGQQITFPEGFTWEGTLQPEWR